jgi:hypothetical protein
MLLTAFFKVSHHKLLKLTQFSGRFGDDPRILDYRHGNRFLHPLHRPRAVLDFLKDRKSAHAKNINPAFISLPVTSLKSLSMKNEKSHIICKPSEELQTGICLQFSSVPNL